MDVLSGTYAAVVGPNYETPAEIRALRHCGADAVGMSTAQEIQAAHDLGMECAAISCITNRAAGLDQGAAITHDEVLHTAKAASRQLARLIEVWIENIK
jgi:purine-nucleoside phosphorylase